MRLTGWSLWLRIVPAVAFVVAAMVGRRLEGPASWIWLGGAAAILIGLTVGEWVRRRQR
jgi:hypothetical protein